MNGWLKAFGLRGTAETTGAPKPDQPCSLIGVVGALGAYSREDSGEHADRKSDHGVGSLPLVAWRINDGPIEIGNLVISAAIEADAPARAAFEAMYQAGAIIAAKADTMPMALSTMSLLRVSEICLANEDDPELKRTAQEIMEPAPFSHPNLGEFTPHPRLPSEFIGHARWCGRRVEIWLQESGPKADRAALRRRADGAAHILAHEDTFAKSLHDVLLQQLYPQWLENVGNTGLATLSPEDWLAKLPVTAIYPSTGDLVEFELDGRELFGNDESVMASALLPHGFTDAGLVG